MLLVTVIGCVPEPAAVNGSQSREEETATASDSGAETGTGIDLTTPMAASEREPVTLEVWYAVSGTSGEKFTEQAQAFDESSDLVSLNLSYSGGSNDTATKVSAALLTGTEPDIALMYAGPSFTGSLGNFDRRSSSSAKDLTRTTSTPASGITAATSPGKSVRFRMEFPRR